MKWLDKITGGYSSSAKVVDGALILSLPDAVSPVVWRMELEDVKAAALEIEAKDNVYILTMRQGKTDKKEIAPFENRAKAVNALIAASSALENAHSTTKTHIESAPRSGKGSNFTSALIAVLILIMLIAGLSRIGPRVQTAADLSGTAASSQFAAPSQGTPGTPQSADDFLMGR